MRNFFYVLATSLIVIIPGGKLCGKPAPSGVYKTTGRYMTLYFGNDDPYYGTYFDVIVTSYHRGNNLILLESLSEFDQEIPPSHIAGQTTAP